MKAVQFNEYGDASVLAVNNIDKPELKDGQVLVEVHAASLNPFDSMVRSGYLSESVPLELPVTLGGDIAGTITEVSNGIDALKAGDKVYGQANVVAGNSGAFAEFAATAAGQVAPMPEKLSFTEAAALPLVGVSAWQALVTHLNLQRDQRLLLLGGAGGIGTVAIQIAKHIGAHVTTTASGEGLDYAKKLGADVAIDYKTEDITKLTEKFDAVFDTVGGDEFNKALPLLKQGGIGVSMIAEADEAKTQELGVTAITQSTHVTAEALNELTKLVDAGAVSPHVDKIFSLDQIQEAFKLREGGTVIGKVVVDIKQ